MTPITEKFFALLRYSIGGQQEPPAILDEEWEPVSIMAVEQSLIGVLCQGVSRMSTVMPLSDEVKLTCFLQTEQIAEANKKMNAATVKVTKRLNKEGFDCCILNPRFGFLATSMYGWWATSLLLSHWVSSQTQKPHQCITI